MPDHVPLAGPQGRVTALPAPEEWLRWQPLWDAYFVVAALGSIAAVLLTGEPAPVRRAAAAGLLAVLVAAHLLLGRRLIRAARGSRTALLYQLAVVVVFTAAVLLAPASAFILFALCGPVFMTVGPVVGTPVVLVLNLVWLAGAPAGALLPVAVAGAVLSVLLGVWASSIIRQSTQRAELIHELRRTRSEVGRLSYEAGRVAEREQVADALHDTLAQGLSSTIMLVQAAGATLDTDAERARYLLALAEATTRDNLADARALIASRPLPEAAPASLADTLGREVDRLRDVHGIDARLRIDGTTDPGDTALNVDLLRLAQEALSNVRKHAHAGRVDVTLAAGDDGIRLEISDDGRGFTPGITPSGHGLPLMRRRLHAVGGQLHIDSAPGTGTRIRIQVPA
ncbi:sensor histidine kinase [Actinoplanes awajinensis]|uniref:Oxygen sensor histidine kinase NreB n=1 Tax=Actinoplanes awajinensis subsp. mycoplanecinus TaxID=135947 RepID=A0A101JHB7_9ACTN|nr:sensor histidine kinase [Actinoplanes awajinensis]KUL26900.1 hypothetical protein ADL15_36795 [Actinoplanes awajinensis subsp. mycoplanecinus]